MTAPGRYPFGSPVTARPASADGPRRVLVLGAYPSAVHVRWRPPAGLGRAVRAVPVADEPTPFWDGADADRHVEAWRRDVGWNDEWGHVEVPAELNGPSGKKVDELILRPLGVSRDETWITDCLDTYRASTSVMRALASVYDPLITRLGLPPHDLQPHPGENQIVAEAVTAHRDRLRDELRRCQPELVVTLGNAALRTLREVVDDAEHGPPATGLVADGYPHGGAVVVAAHRTRFLALAHPGSRGGWPQRHAAWAAHDQAGRAGVCI